MQYNSLGKQSDTYNYDAVYHLTSTVYSDNSSTSTIYDAAGEVTSTKDANGNVTQYVYDDAGRRTQTIDALNHTTVFAYDNAGQQTSVTDANQHKTQYVYDNAGRFDYLEYAKKVGLTLYLYVRVGDGTQLSGDLQDLEAAGEIIVRRIIPATP